MCFVLVAENPEANSGPYQTSKMERIVKIDNGWKPLTVFSKSTIIDVWKGSEAPLEFFTTLLELCICKDFCLSILL